jgi:toxin-antitoxin system PIN domain toxin
VTLLDTNILLYATFADAPEHARARGWVEGRLADPDGSLALCWPVVYAFARLASSPRVFGRHAVTVERAWAAIAAYLDQPAVRMVTPGERHRSIAAELAATPGLRSEDVPDIELAALAIEHGLVLASHDSGFRRFAGLRTLDPLAA